MEANGFSASQPWQAANPSTLVVICSDGRVEAQADEYLKSIGVSGHDRLYVPGGPGAFVPADDSEAAAIRANVQTDELRFLVRAHQIKTVLLMFHGAAADGKLESMCADYARLHPGQSVEWLRSRQESDGHKVISSLASEFPGVEFKLCRVEVGPDFAVIVQDLS